MSTNTPNQRAKPSNNKRGSSFSLNDESSFSEKGEHERAKKIKKQVVRWERTRASSSSLCEYSSSCGDKGAKVDPKLFHLLLNAKHKGHIDNEAETIRVIQNNPIAACGRYILHESQCCPEYPIYLVLELGASFDLVNVLYKAFPFAVYDSYGNSRMTLLHQACTHGASPEVISLLLEEHSDAVKVTDRHHRTPLHNACDRFPSLVSLEVVTLLVEKWPEAIKIEDVLSMTPLHHACANQAPYDVVSLLLEKCPSSIKKKDITGSTPLNFACKFFASWEVISLLIETWPNAVGMKALDGRFPVHNACRHHASVEIMSALLEICPQAVNEKDCCGKTPKQYFCEGIEHVIHHDLYDDVHLILTGVNRLFDDDVTLLGAMHVLRDFIWINWSGGVLIVLMTYPSAIKGLDGIPLNVIPSLLSMLGRRCPVGILWNMISNRQDILKID